MLQNAVPRRRFRWLGFSVLLACLFAGLKMAGVVGWSWWWVLSPLWIYGAGHFALGVLALASGALSGDFE